MIISDLIRVGTIDERVCIIEREAIGRQTNLHMEEKNGLIGELHKRRADRYERRKKERETRQITFKESSKGIIELCGETNHHAHWFDIWHD